MDEKQKIFETYETPDPVRIKKVIKFIRGHFKEIKGLNILDCGISKGGVTDVLSKESANCFGVDINPREINGVKIVKADLNDGIPGFGIKFDVIFAGEIIEHLYDDVKFIRECKKSLRQDGILVITVPNLVSLTNRLLMLFGTMPLEAHAADPFHYHVYNKKKLQNSIKEEGFQILKSTSSYLLLNTKINFIGAILGFLGDIFPSLGIQLMIFAKKIGDTRRKSGIKQNNYFFKK